MKSERKATQAKTPPMASGVLEGLYGYPTFVVEQAEIANYEREFTNVEWGAAVEREQTTIRLPRELLEQLRREAQVKGYSFNGYVHALILKGQAVESSRSPFHSGQ